MENDAGGGKTSGVKEPKPRAKTLTEGTEEVREAMRSSRRGKNQGWKPREILGRGLGNLVALPSDGQDARRPPS